MPFSFGWKGGKWFLGRRKGYKEQGSDEPEGYASCLLMVSSYADELQIRESINAWERQNRVLRVPQRNDSFAVKCHRLPAALESILGVRHFIQAYRLASTCCSSIRSALLHMVGTLLVGRTRGAGLAECYTEKITRNARLDVAQSKQAPAQFFLVLYSGFG